MKLYLTISLLLIAGMAKGQIDTVRTFDPQTVTHPQEISGMWEWQLKRLFRGGSAGIQTANWAFFESITYGDTLSLTYYPQADSALNPISGPAWQKVYLVVYPRVQPDTIILRDTIFLVPNELRGEVGDSLVIYRHGND